MFIGYSKSYHDKPIRFYDLHIERRYSFYIFQYEFDHLFKTVGALVVWYVWLSCEEKVEQLLKRVKASPKLEQEFSRNFFLFVGKNTKQIGETALITCINVL